MESLHYLLMKTHTVLQRRIVSRAAGLGLTPGQPKILDYLLRYGKATRKRLRPTAKSSRLLSAASCCAWKRRG